MIKILVNGAYGKLGRVACDALLKADTLRLVGECSRGDDLVSAIHQYQPDVMLDVTSADVVFENTLTILHAGARPVIGATGLSPHQVLELTTICDELKRGCLLAPNFSMGAMLMMKYAADAAKYFDAVEIIEKHHDQKREYPSGTAMKTADMIATSRAHTPSSIDEKAIIPGARGANHHQIPIHSIRLPGLLAHQEVIFGGQGETFTLSHNTLSRDCFSKGILLACQKVMTLDRLVNGLHHFLE